MSKSLPSQFNDNEGLTQHNKDLRFDAFFNSASMATIVVNGAGLIVMANKFAHKLFKFDQDKLLGIQLEQLIPQRYHHNHHSHREKYVAKPTARPMGANMTLSAVRLDGTEFPVEISLGHFETGNDKYTIAFIIDITIRKENEQKIAKQQEEMELVNQEMIRLNANLEATVHARTIELQNTLKALEASKEELTISLEKEKEVNDLKTRFVSMASHEFRTPLSTILSSISLLSKYSTAEDQPKRDKHIDRIKSSVKSLTDILNEFLSLGKIEEGKVDVKREEFDIEEFMNGVIYEMNVLLKNGQHFSYTHQGNQITFSDSNLLKHVVINLLSNAIKFSPENSTVQILTKIVDDITTIEITDSGIGIPKGDQIHLFERFFRATNVTNIQGTGLGLHIVGRYVELLSGNIEYNSELEKGSTFIVKLDTSRNQFSFAD